MATHAPRWVIGHRVAPVETESDYALLHITTPSKAPGPPPHYHDDTSELFLVLKGEMEVMCDGRWTWLRAGESMVIPQGSVHTFRNEGPEEIEWITAFSPRRFEEFFHEFGVPATQPGARESSLSEEMLHRVAAGCSRLGMILQSPPPAR